MTGYCGCCGAHDVEVKKPTQGTFKALCPYCYETFIGIRCECDVGDGQQRTLLRTMAQCFNVLEKRLNSRLQWRENECSQ